MALMDLCSISNLVYFLGLAVLVKGLAKFGFFVNRWFVRKPHDVHERYGKDSWILVTGATAGIGLGICKYAASDKNLNVVLVGRNSDKLKKSEQEVKEANPKIKTKTLVLDFNASTDLEYYYKALEPVKDLDISIIVNNAGVASICDLEEVTQESLKEMTETNMHGLTVLTKMFVDRFAKRATRSAIVNVSSIGGYNPLPACAHYAGTKAFVTSFTNGFGYEVKDKLDVLCHCPGAVSSAMSAFKISFDTALPRDCAFVIFRDLGYERENQPIIGQEATLLGLSIMGWISGSLLLAIGKIAITNENKGMLERRKNL
jgi:short-subunit dehydrogenase